MQGMSCRALRRRCTCWHQDEFVQAAVLGLRLSHKQRKRPVLLSQAHGRCGQCQAVGCLHVRQVPLPSAAVNSRLCMGGERQCPDGRPCYSGCMHA